MASDSAWRKLSGFLALGAFALGVPIVGPLINTTFRTEVPAKFIERTSPISVPQVAFQDGEGRGRTLADFHGKMVLVNVWATWCVPCRREMPALDRLQAVLGSDQFEVVALSIDRGGLRAVRAFYDRVGVSRLAPYVDDSGSLATDLGAIGIPTTLLINAEGSEVARLIGPAEWDVPEMIALLRSKLVAPGHRI